VLAALNIGAVLVGVATGGLAASVLGLILGSALTLLGVDQGPGIGLVVGMLSGLAAGGWVSGKRARHSARFHGAVTGLVMAFLVLVIAVLGGSPASTVSVIWLAVLSMAIASLSGWLAGRRAGPTG
jgi:putative membrane protein (TIGR04086 family)